MGRDLFDAEIGQLSPVPGGGWAGDAFLHVGPRETEAAGQVKREMSAVAGIEQASDDLFRKYHYLIVRQSGGFRALLGDESSEHSLPADPSFMRNAGGGAAFRGQSHPRHHGTR